MSSGIQELERRCILSVVRFLKNDNTLISTPCDGQHRRTGKSKLNACLNVRSSGHTLSVCGPRASLM